MTEYYIGQKFEEDYPMEAAIWCNENNAIIVELEKEQDKRIFQIQEIPVHIPTEEEQRKKRAEAYRQEVDPITSHISRLKDEEQTEEVVAKIQELIEERRQVVERIQRDYPYPVEEPEYEAMD